MRSRFLFLILCLLLTDAHAQAALTLTVWTPTPYSITQRFGNTGTLHITGEIRPAGNYMLEAKWGTLNWQIVQSAVTRVFDTTLQVPAGQDTLWLRVNGIEKSVEWVGVGDVYVIAGQSNAMGAGVTIQAYSHPTLKAGMFPNTYLWRELKDPAAGLGGSVWPLLATAIMADQNVPVGFVPTAQGSTSVLMWQPTDIYDEKTLFGAMLDRIWAVGQVKAVLWLQGEHDAITGRSTQAYKFYLENIATALCEQTGAPLVVATLYDLLSYAPAKNVWQIDRAIQLAAADHPCILPGPDLSDILTDDAAHVKSKAKMEIAAERWWLSLKALFYSE